MIIFKTFKASLNYNEVDNKLIVNHHTYLRRLTSKGTTACVKRLSERVRAQIKIPMDRLTNPNSMVGSKAPCFNKKNMRGISDYVISLIPNQSKQPARSSRLIGGSPKGMYCQKRSEFGISRNTKVWGRRRIHSTVFINGKESSKFMIVDTWFEGQNIKNHFQKLFKDLDNNARANNLTTIMGNRDFLIGCYLNIKFKQGNTPRRIRPETLDSIDIDWFDKVAQTFRNGKFTFRPTRRTYIFKPDRKRRPFTIPSLKDRIVQEGMRILLECIFNAHFRESSHAFRSKRGCHTALNQIRLHFGKSKWFIKGDINKQYLNIDHNILVSILRKKIQDEPFIDLVYKYLRVGYKEKFDEITVMKKGFVQRRSISLILSDIYTHPFDTWMEAILIPKYTEGKRKKANSEYTNLCRQQERVVGKPLNFSIANDKNSGRVVYVRYGADFLIGVIGSKETCAKIRKEIKVFLEKRLSMTLDLDNTHVTHSTTEKVVFLGYEIACALKYKLSSARDSRKQLSRKTTCTVMNAPIKRVVELLQLKGFLNGKNQPTRCGRYINTDLWNIIDSYKSIERGILNYYSMANNYGRLAARVHYILKYSCALTTSSKMKLKTLRGAFKRYGKNLTIKVGDESISYPKILYKRRHVGNPKGPCVAYGSLQKIEVHHLKALKDN